MHKNSKYSLELAEQICEEIAGGTSLNQIIKEGRCPSYATVCTWLRERPEFLMMYNIAKADQAEFGAAEIRNLSDEQPPLVEGRVDNGWVSWQRNRIDARKWIAAKLLPKVYGERSHATLEIPQGPAVQMTDAEALAEIAKLSQELGLKYQMVEIVEEGDDE